MDWQDGKRTNHAIITAQNLSQVPSLLGGTFIEVTRHSHSGDNWPVWHVRTSAIVALQPTGGERGYLNLRDGAQMRIVYADVVAALAQAPFMMPGSAHERN